MPLIGTFGAASARATGLFGRRNLVQTSIDRTTGTNIGDMTDGGGLAAAFDGTTSQAGTASAAKNNVGVGTYVGKSYGVAKIFSRAEGYPSNNFGWRLNAATITINFRAKNGAPSSASDGTLLATQTLNSGTTTGPLVFDASSNTVAYTHCWLDIANAASGSNTYCAELQLWEWL